MSVGLPELLVVVGLLIGVIVVITLLVLAVVRSGAKCPTCYGRVDRRASVCPHCRAVIA